MRVDEFTHVLTHCTVYVCSALDSLSTPDITEQETANILYRLTRRLHQCNMDALRGCNLLSEAERAYKELGYDN